MSDIFSGAWMARFKDEWNNEPDLSDALGKISFNSVIGYGVDGEDKPRGVIKIENGKVTNAGDYAGEQLNWDLRASEDNWNNWFSKDIGAVGLGTAYTTRKLKFETGDYSAMIKDPRMAAPFIKSFSVMGRV
ncbi:MAG: SCP-2 sterol transfer family protein [Proteobacteria bacterium]|nr:SCP-2 sterol transfer family protein [Pseudomonadota bacterium]